MGGQTIALCLRSTHEAANVRSKLTQVPRAAERAGSAVGPVRLSIRDKASEGLLASGDERMEDLIEFRETLIRYRDPENGKRDMKRMNGSDGPGPLTMTARRELLTQAPQITGADWPESYQRR